MKQDPNFPLKLNTQIIMDRRSGAQLESKKHTAFAAMLELMQATEKVDFDAMNEQQQRELTDFTGSAAMKMLIGQQMERPADGILRVGPFETQDRCTHMKNMMMAEAIVREKNPELADFIQTELIDDSPEEGAPKDPIGEALERAFPGSKVIELRGSDIFGGGGLESLFGGRREEPSLGSLLAQLLASRRR